MVALFVRSAPPEGPTFPSLSTLKQDSGSHIRHCDVIV